MYEWNIFNQFSFLCTLSLSFFIGMPHVRVMNVRYHSQFSGFVFLISSLKSFFAEGEGGGGVVFDELYVLCK